MAFFSSFFSSSTFSSPALAHFWHLNRLAVLPRASTTSSFVMLSFLAFTITSWVFLPSLTLPDLISTVATPLSLFLSDDLTLA